MKRIRQLHLYLGTFFAPLIIFFAISGALQTFSLHESRKDGSYTAPRWIMMLAQIHKNSRLSPGQAHSVAMEWIVALMAACLVVTTLLGIYMAFRFNRNKGVVWALIGAGIALPVVALIMR